MFKYNIYMIIPLIMKINLYNRIKSSNKSNFFKPNKNLLKNKGN